MRNPPVLMRHVRHRRVVQAEEALVRRLVGPDRLHVVHDVVFHVHLQPSDIRQVIVVIAQGLGVALKQSVQGGDFPLHAERQVTDLVGGFFGSIL